MALVKCPECNGEFSDLADACPHCGCPKDKALAIIAEREEKEKQQSEKLCRDVDKAFNDLHGDDEAGKPQLGKESTKNKRALVVLMVFAIGILFASYKLYIPTPTSSETAKQQTQEDPLFAKYAKVERNKESVYYETQDYVKGQLKAPSTADFPRYSKINVELLEDGITYKIYAYVDSDNSYGAKIRTKYYLKAMENGSTWRILDLKFIVE